MLRSRFAVAGRTVVVTGAARGHGAAAARRRRERVARRPRPDKLAALDEIVRNRGYLLNISSLSAASHTPLMGGYTASKAGVEAMTDCLRVERAPSGARVGCVYFGFIDTDLVTASFAHPSTQALTAVPGFVARPAPLAQAVDAIEREPV